MFEIAGYNNLISLEELEKWAKEDNKSIDEYIKTYNIKDLREPGKTTPTTPGAVVEETAAPELTLTESPSVDISLELPKVKIETTNSTLYKPKKRTESEKKIDILKNTMSINNPIAAAMPDFIIPILADWTAMTSETIAGVVDTAEILYEGLLAATTDETFEKIARKQRIDMSEVYEGAEALRNIREKKYDDQGNELDAIALWQSDRKLESAQQFASEAIGSLPSTILTYMLPGAGSVIIGAGTLGKEFEANLKERPQETAEKMLLNASIKGGAEALFELVGGYTFKTITKAAGRGLAEKAVKELTKDAVPYILGKVLGIGAQALSEATTEALTGVTQLGADELVFDDPIDAKQYWRTAIHSGIVGGLMGGGITAGVVGTQLTGDRKKAALAIITPKQWKEDQLQIGREINQAAKDFQVAPPNKKKFFKNKIEVLEQRQQERVDRLTKTWDGLTRIEKINYAKLLDEADSQLDIIGNNKYTKKAQDDAQLSLDEAYSEMQNILGKDNIDASTEQNISKTLKASQSILEQVEKAKTIKNLNIQYVSNEIFQKVSKAVTGKKSAADAIFFDGNNIYINKDRAAQTKQTNVVGHELLHYVMAKNFDTSNESMQPLINSFKDYLKQTQPEIFERIEFRINSLYTNKKTGRIEKGALEEYLNVFSDLIAKEKIIVNENFSDKIKNATTRFLNGLGFGSIKLETGKDVFNFIRNYNKNISNFKYKQLGINITSDKISKDINEEVVKKSISGDQDLYSNTEKALGITKDDSGNVTWEGFDENKARLAGYLWTNDVERRLRKYKNYADYNTFKEDIISEVTIGDKKGARGIVDIIRRWDPSKTPNIAQWINGQIENKILGVAQSFGIGKDFKLDVTEAKGIADVTTIEKEIEIKEQVAKPKISFTEQLNITPQIKEKITQTVIKTFGTKLPSIDSKDFKEKLIKSYRNELKPIIAKMMGTQEKYETFLADNFKSIYSILPQSTINKRFNEFAEPVLDKDGKQLREKTAEGKKIFVKKDITKAEWLNYFIGRNVAPSKKGTRKTSIAEEIGVELAFDATSETLSNENILNKFKEIQDLQGNILPENFIDIIERKIDRQNIKFSKTVEQKGVLLEKKSLIINDLRTNGISNQSIKDSFQNNLKGLLSDPEIEDLTNEFIKELKPFKNIELKYLDDYFNKIINKEISSKAYTPGRILEYLNFKIKHLSVLIKKFPQLKTDLKNGVFKPIRKKAIEKYGEEKAAILWYSFMRQTIASRGSFLYKNKTQEFDAEFKKEWGEKLYDVAVKNAINPSVKGRVISEIINDKGEPWFSRAKEAQDFLKFISEEGANIIKDEYSDIHAIYFFDQLKSAEMGLIRLAALPKYAVIIDPYHKNLSFDELDKIYIYEHTMPAAYFRNALYDYYYNNNSNINIDALFDDYTVTLLPRNWDKTVNKAGFLDNMPASYSPGNIPVFIRYFNDFVIDIAKKENIQFYDIIDITTGEIAAPANTVIKFSKSTNKKLRVFDFDDTLARSKSNVLYTMPDGTKGKLNAEQFAKQSDELQEQGAIFDFSEFSKVIGGQKGPMFDVAKAILEKRGDEDLFILTARPAEAKYAIQPFLANLGLPFKLENIIGLGNGSPQAKADWIASKLNLGYNDVYFADDALKNVEAVAKTLSAYDIKYRSQAVKASKSLDIEFNEILQQSTGVEFYKEYSPVKAELLGRGKGRFKFFVPYDADDFVGLLYTTLGKGKTGDAQMEWYKENLLKPFSRGIQQYEAAKQRALRDWADLKAQIKKDVPAGLNKQNETGFRNQDSVRIYIWHTQGIDMTSKEMGMSKSDLNDNLKYIRNNPALKAFADKLMALNVDGYPDPTANWTAGDITTDLVSYINDVKRKEYLQPWKDNIDIIFSDKNKNKLKALYGNSYIESLDDMLYRMWNGRNRKIGVTKKERAFQDWINNSVGTVMFFNSRSALLQTISAINFINFTDNNPINAAAAFANQKQYWADFSELFNSDFLKQRRSGLQIDINADEIANAAATSRNKAKAALSAILKFGFTPTQIADSFAIASGGATFYRNRIKKYLKEGLTQEEAQKKAFEDFQETAEESQQSARPDRISMQQASSLGRTILAWGNTPMQYARIQKKAALDLINGRGDWKTNVSKIMYYGVIQNIIFSALQQGLFALLFSDEEDEKEKERYFRVGNSMLDTFLRGAGIYGAVASTAKNVIMEIIDQAKSSRPDYTQAAIAATTISPPVNSKLRKLISAGKTFTYKQSKEKVFTEGFSLENPAFLAGGQVISAVANIPVDRVVQKADHIYTAMKPETELWQSLALSLGWSEWDLGIIEKQIKKSKNKSEFEVKEFKTGFKTKKFKTK